MKKHAQSSNQKTDSFGNHFNRRDIIWLLVGIVVLFLLSYAVIQFDIVSVETFAAGMSKYNVTAANAGVGGVLG